MLTSWELTDEAVSREEDIRLSEEEDCAGGCKGCCLLEQGHCNGREI